MKARIILGSLVLSVVLGFVSVVLTFADLKDLANEYRAQTAVIIPTTQSDDSNYGLLVLPREDYLKATDLSPPSNPTQVQKLENNYFKIVENEGSEALPILDFDGDNVLYHLMNARSYFEKLSQASGIPNPSLDHKIIVRIRVSEHYNPATQFTQWKSYNDARHIPAESPLFKNLNPSIPTWDSEIWFQQRKGQLHLSADQWINMGLDVGSSVLTKSVLSLPITIPLELYEHYNAGLDSVKIPNVIYHEVFHWATDTEGLFPQVSEGNPVAEDYANYFGSSLLGRPGIAELEEFSSRVYRRNYNEIKPVKDSNKDDYNAYAFGPSVFWQIRKWLGADRGDQLIWNSLQNLKGSDHHTDVPLAVLQAIKSNEALVTPAEAQQIEDLFKKNASSYDNLDKKFHQ